MAPALTQTEPPNLADTTCHTPDSSTNTPLPYDNLKVLRKIKSPQDSKEFCESEQIITSNGDCVSPSLAPPACGWAEGRPMPNSSPTELNMDEQSPLPVSSRDNSHTSSEQTASSNSNMGFQTHVANFEVASSLIGKAAEAVTVSHEDSNTVLGNQSELLALVGRDFDNVNEIIDTLQRLASNPELLDAAAQELEPQSSNISQNAQTRNQTPENRAMLTLNRLGERQRKLERRRQFLLRRLRRVTARGLGMTISSQINYMTRHIGGLLEEERLKKREKCVKENVEEPIGLEMLHKESMKSMSTSDLISLVRRVEASNNLQRLNDRAKRAMCIPEEISTIPIPLAAELDTVASEMKGAVLAHVCHDSDATESSSGGESCDESEFFSDTNTEYKLIKERAFYKFCRNRGWIASKWMWLQAQIADLDNRILQQQKYYAHLRKIKGVIQLAEEPQHTKSQIPLKRSPAHLEMQDPALTCIGSLGPRTVLNGYHPSTKIEDMNSLNGYANGHEFLNVGCARTFGIHKVKRRRYLKPNLLLKRSVEGFPNSTNKFIKVSPVFCKCVPPVTCVLCVKFRTSNKNTSNYENYWATLSKLGVNSAFSLTEKISKKDPGFHSVLSKISEIRQGEVYSSLLKSSDWQQKCLICKPLTTYQRENLSSSSEVLEQPIIKKKKKNKEHKRNGRRKHSRDDSRDRITLKLKKSMFIDTIEPENTLREAKRKLEISEIPGGTMKSLNEEELVDCDDELGSVQMSVSGSANSSPCPSPAFPEKGALGGQGDMKNNRKPTGSRQKQNSTSSSYDINNIVIPYSMAAASRVELIQYKEIPTPKWRIEEILPLSQSQRNGAAADDDEEIEDISDEAIAIRHRKSEIDEHKKYLNYYNSLTNASRSSRARRADSSGTNTPDHPLSPRPSELLLENSPVGSPPDTPLSPQCLLPSENPSTVLTLSLSSLKSSLLKSSHHLSLECEELSNSSNCNLSSLKCQPKILSAPPSSCLLESSEAPLPASRTRRSHSTSITNVAHPLEKPRLSSLSEEQSEKERISPFPSRNFPLKENEYQDLVFVNDNDSNNNNSSNSNTKNNESGDDEDVNSIGSFNQPEESESICTASHRDTLGELTEKKTGKINNFCIDEESGRGSPLSELTDSAPEQEEEGSWEEGASATPPDWTISAVNDQCGGFVLTVQKN